MKLGAVNWERVEKCQVGFQLSGGFKESKVPYCSLTPPLLLFLVQPRGPALDRGTSGPRVHGSFTVAETSFALLYDPPTRNLFLRLRCLVALLSVTVVGAEHCHVPSALPSLQGPFLGFWMPCPALFPRHLLLYPPGGYVARVQTPSHMNTVECFIIIFNVSVGKSCGFSFPGFSQTMGLNYNR